jgi:hypothetical protein
VAAARLPPGDALYASIAAFAERRFAVNSTSLNRGLLREQLAQFTGRSIPKEPVQLARTPARRGEWWAKTFGVRSELGLAFLSGPAWMAIGLLTLVLRLHGNPRSWQFSYRYAMVLLLWMFLLPIGNGPAQIAVIELSHFGVSVAINATATYQFFWTNLIHP